MNKRRLADDPIFLSNCRWVISYICIWTTNKIWPLCACRSIDVAIILLLQLLRTATAAQTVQGCCRCRCLYSTVSVQYVYSYFNVLYVCSRVQLFQCVARVHLMHLFKCDIHVLSCTVVSMWYPRTLVYIYFNVLHAYSRVQLLQCVTRVLSCTVTSMCYTRTLVCSYFNVLHAYSRSYFNMLHAYIRHSYFNVFLKSQVVTLQTPQTVANAGVCGGLCACAVGGTYN